jgi:hypothetical protein
MLVVVKPVLEAVEAFVTQMSSTPLKSVAR